MQVTHIIPAAFNYFDDIKEEAFGLVEKLPYFGVAVEAFTLQYNNVSKKNPTGAEGKPVSKEMEFDSMGNVVSMLDSLENSDIVHVHCPHTTCS